MYTVTHNDTPATIAEKFTGNWQRFPELIAANPHKPRHGQTFASLTVGEHLRMPSSWRSDLGRGGGGGHGGGGGGHGGHGGGGRGGPAHVAPTHVFHGGQAPSQHAQTPGGNQAPGQPPSGHQSPVHGPGHPGHPGHHPPHHGHHGPPIGRRFGWGGWGWGGGFWNGDWWPYYFDVSEAQVEACSWTSLGSIAGPTDAWRTRDFQQAQAKARELVGKLKPGEVQFLRFADSSGIFQFYVSQDGKGIVVDRCDDGIVGVGQNYLWDRYPGEIDPEKPAHTLSAGLAGEPQGVGACGCSAVTVGPEAGAHHNCCQYPSSECSCDILGWNYAADSHQGDCPYRDPNYGSDQIHLLAGIGPLGPACDTTGTMLGTPQGSSAVAPSVQNFVQGFGQGATADGSSTIPPIPGMIDQPVLTPAAPAPPSALPWDEVPPNSPTAAPTAMATTTVAPPTTPNTAMVVAGIVAVGLGVAGIAYLAHSRMAK